MISAAGRLQSPSLVVLVRSAVVSRVSAPRNVGSESPTLVKKTHEPSLEFLALRKGELQRRFSALWSVISAAPSTASAFY